MRSRKTKFTWREWYWTMPEENLFTLTREELFVYKSLVKETAKEVKND